MQFSALLMLAVEPLNTRLLEPLAAPVVKVKPADVASRSVPLVTESDIVSALRPADGSFSTIALLFAAEKISGVFSWPFTELGAEPVGAVALSIHRDSNGSKRRDER